MSEATTEAERHALLERLFAAFNRHDADGVMACFTPGVVFDTAAGPEAHGRRLTGQESVRAAFVAVWTDMPDVAWTVSRHTLAGSGPRRNGCSPAPGPMAAGSPWRGSTCSCSTVR